MNFSPKNLIRLLESRGYVYKRSSGSHQVYYNSVTNSTIVVPVHSNKDLAKGTFYTILKQAGIERNDL